MSGGPSNLLHFGPIPMPTARQPGRPRRLDDPQFQTIFAIVEQRILLSRWFAFAEVLAAANFTAFASWIDSQGWWEDVLEAYEYTHRVRLVPTCSDFAGDHPPDVNGDPMTDRSWFDHIRLYGYMYIAGVPNGRMVSAVHPEKFGGWIQHWKIERERRCNNGGIMAINQREQTLETLGIVPTAPRPLLTNI